MTYHASSHRDETPALVISTQERFHRIYESDSDSRPLPDSIYQISVASFTSESDSTPTRSLPKRGKRPKGKSKVLEVM